MAARLIIVPRWAGTSGSDWYPWLRAELTLHHAEVFSRIHLLDLPDPREPTVAAWASGVREALAEDGEALQQTILVGHSVGCQAALRALLILPPDASVHAVLCVAGWWTVDDPWPSIRPWMELPEGLEGLPARAQHWQVLLSDNDPFTRDAVANRRLWEQRTGATVTVQPGARHFNEPREPAVLEAVLALGRLMPR